MTNEQTVDIVVFRDDHGHYYLIPRQSLEHTRVSAEELRALAEGADIARFMTDDRPPADAGEPSGTAVLPRRLELVGDRRVPLARLTTLGNRAMLGAGGRGEP